LQLSAIQEKN